MRRLTNISQKIGEHIFRFIFNIAYCDVNEIFILFDEASIDDAFESIIIRDRLTDRLSS